jgi:replicative DNA helicase
VAISIPHNQELEQQFLATAIFGRRVLIEDLAGVKPEHFYDPLHGRIWTAAVSCAGRGIPMTVEGLNKILAETGKEDFEYLGELREADTGLSPLHHVKELRRLYFRRQMMNLGEDIIADASAEDPERTTADRIEQAEIKLSELAEIDSGRQRASTMAEARRKADAMIERVHKSGGGLSGITTGLAALDKRLGGMRDSELIIAAGRPGMGKTALALTLAVSAAKAGKKVKLVSLEMSEEQLIQRIYAQFTGISVQEQLKAGAEMSMFRRLADAGNLLDELPITIDAADTQTVGSIRAAARRDKRRDGLDLLIIDYLGLIQPTDPKAQKVHQIEQITTGLKRLSKELNIPVVLLAQLNRGVESRDDKRPGLADLRDSGSIEQDADVVMLLYRAEYYLAKEEPENPDKFAEWDRRREAARGKADIITAKFRQGEIGTDTVRFDGVRQVFADLDNGRRS